MSKKRHESQPNRSAKKPRGSPFTGPDDPRLRQNMEASRTAASVSANVSIIDPPTEASLYDDMVHVRRYPREYDRTEGQRDCRAWKKRDLRGFMSKLADMEKARLTTGADKPAAAATPKAGPVSVVHENGNRLAELTLEEWQRTKDELRFARDSEAADANNPVNELLADEFALFDEFAKNKDAFRIWMGGLTPAELLSIQNYPNELDAMGAKL